MVDSNEIQENQHGEMINEECKDKNRRLWYG
jgi:hypothetical protein